jgi:hypothetical protein
VVRNLGCICPPTILSHVIGKNYRWLRPLKLPVANPLPTIGDPSRAVDKSVALVHVSTPPATLAPGAHRVWSKPEQWARGTAIRLNGTSHRPGPAFQPVLGRV